MQNQWRKKIWQTYRTNPILAKLVVSSIQTAFLVIWWAIFVKPTQTHTHRPDRTCNYWHLAGLLSGISHCHCMHRTNVRTLDAGVGHCEQMISGIDLCACSMHRITAWYHVLARPRLGSHSSEIVFLSRGIRFIIFGTCVCRRGDISPSSQHAWMNVWRSTDFGKIHETMNVSIWEKRRAPRCFYPYCKN